MRRKGKGKGKGLNKGKGRPKLFFIDDISNEEWQEALTYLSSKGHNVYTSGKGFGRKGNPVGKDGKKLKCHICESTEHFAKDCPQAPHHLVQQSALFAKGKGKRKGSGKDNGTPNFVSIPNYFQSEPYQSTASSSHVSPGDLSGYPTEAPSGAEVVTTGGYLSHYELPDIPVQPENRQVRFADEEDLSLIHI